MKHIKIEQEKYINSPNMVIFTPNEYNMKIYNKLCQKCKIIA
ncbi:MAG: hypothetical protein KatS3mg068_0178 [Candidatus Sericytochromatia bacterium]|nr:MAG: hypothetical protein KatS3mg068_0178 [Candidatus Sericytochromatia bacterium]